MQPLGKSLAAPQKVKYRITYDPAIPVLGIYPKYLKELEQIFTVFIPVLHNGQKVETTQWQWMDKQKCDKHTYSGILLP